jgi:DNA-binding phage protein
MSNAEVLKQANAIDQAAMTAVMSDDEKPSDFISDCREVVNLSRGFNSNGQMRVGGR